MRFSVADILDTLAPWVPPALVAPPMAARVREYARWMPAFLADRFYLETRLGPDAPDVDLSFDTSPAGYEALAGRSTALSMPAAFAGHEAWARIGHLYRMFADPSTRIGRYGWKILLEFDVRAGPMVLPTPGVFVGLQPPERTRHGVQGATRRVALYTGFTRDVVRCLHTETLPRQVDEQLRRCCAALPAEADLLYIGFMLGRPRAAIRLCVRLPAEGVPDYVDQIGWPGAGQRLAALPEGLARAGMRPLFHVDLWDAVQPRMGMEFFFARPPQQAGRLVEQYWLDKLVHARLCTPEKRQALLAWPGSTALQFPHVFWPTIVQRRVNHVKLVWTPETVSAKAYLFAMIAARIR